MKPLLASLLFCAGLLLCPSAWAKCSRSNRPVVVLVTRVKPPDQLIADLLRQHLKTSLNDRGIDLCMDSAAPREPIGRILLEVTREESAPISALIRIGDRITNKRVERTMPLDSIPVDARPLSVSAAADELLRASWAELLLTDAPAPAMAPPSAVTTSLSDSLTPRRIQLGLEAAGTGHTKLATIGPMLHFGFALTEDVSFALRGHFAASPNKTSTNGTVSLFRQGAQLASAYTFLRAGRHAHLDWQLGVEVARFQFSALQAQAEGSPARVLDWTVEAHSGPRAFLALSGRTALTLGAFALYSLRPVAAADDGTEVLSSAGLGGQVTLGVQALF